MIEILGYLDHISEFLFLALLVLQAAVNFFLPPEQAKKWNFIGRGLEYLASTKKGFGLKK